jgi:hypothetical protein
MSLANLRRALRAALPDELRWVTPHSFRRTVATVVRDGLGPALAQQQLSHSKLSTTEAHYLQRHTHGPDVRNTLDRFAAGIVADESIRKYQVGPNLQESAVVSRCISAARWSRLGCVSS